MRIIVFAYDFPHVKTNVGINNLLSNEIRPDVVISQPFKKLNLPQNKIQFKSNFKDLKSTKYLCESLDIPYFRAEHNSDDSVDYIKRVQPDVGIILGARILSNNIIKLFKRGILNIHHGFIPENRGLNTMQWAILRNQKQAVTSHFIDQNIDLGEIIESLEIPVNTSDSLENINDRINEYEQRILISSLSKIKEGYIGTFINEKGVYNPALTENNLEDYMISKFEDYKKQYPNLNRYPIQI
tara:strand:- start:3974 stop:4696 length:723 start_codon:yes stop_codon:yes gene_type:complete